MNGFRKISVAAVLALAIAGCAHSGDYSVPADAVAIVGNDVLTASQVARMIPAGAVSADSAALAATYVRTWIERKLIEQVASQEVDMDEVNRLVADYRDELIMAQYRRAMAQQTGGEFADDSIRAYFDSHQSDFKLERPLLKGIYLKVPDDASNLRTIRQLYKSDRPDDIDRLEKAANSSAVHYDYFRDTWVDWEQIETRIPLDFSGENFAKISRRQPVDYECDGFVYLLSVSDFLPAGTLMPYEAAKPIIVERLLAQRRRSFDKKLLKDLYEHAVETGTVRFPASEEK